MELRSKKMLSPQWYATPAKLEMVAQRRLDTVGRLCGTLDHQETSG